MTADSGPDVDRDLVVRRDDQVLTEEVDGEAVLYHEGDGTIHVLDPIGTVVWRMLEAPVRLGDVIDVLIEVSDADEPTVERDVLGLAREFAQVGLLDGFDAVTPAEGDPEQPEAARTRGRT